ncbi:hypothetical protein KKA95_04455 [Patescibacteria group bacterium]|nr:hypothetical protein [Patescibacteria group bacterium]
MKMEKKHWQAIMITAYFLVGVLVVVAIVKKADAQESSRQEHCEELCAPQSACFDECITADDDDSAEEPYSLPTSIRAFLGAACAILLIGGLNIIINHRQRPI